ncbi:hypothetical protein, partial [Staphylococcus aureus]
KQVDAVKLHTVNKDRKTVIHVLQVKLKKIKRGVANLLGEHIMFLNRVSLYSNDRLPMNSISAEANEV